MTAYNGLKTWQRVTADQPKCKSALHLQYDVLASVYYGFNVGILILH